MAKLNQQMTLSSYEGNCTAWILNGFPFDRNHLAGNRHDTPDYAKNKQELIDLLECNSNWLESSTWVTATLTDGQETATKLLEEFGFVKSEAIQGIYPELVSIFNMPCKTLLTSMRKIKEDWVPCESSAPSPPEEAEDIPWEGFQRA